MMSWAITSGPQTLLPSKLLSDDSYPQDSYIHLSIHTLRQMCFPLSVCRRHDPSLCVSIESWTLPMATLETVWLKPSWLGMTLPTRECCLQAEDTVLSDSISRLSTHHRAPDASLCPLQSEAHPLSKPTPTLIPSTDAYLHPPPRLKLLDRLYHNIIHSLIVGACIL